MNPALIAANQRDVGLLRAIGPWALAASIINVVVGATIFVIPATLAANVGSYAPLVFLVCAFAVTAVAICFAEGGSRVPTSGGAYGYVNAAFGTLTGYVAGTLLWFGNALGSAGIAAALADGLTSLLPLQFRLLARVALIVGVIGGIALLNLGGVSRGSRVAAGATVVKLIPLAVFVIAGVGAVQRTNYVAMPHLDTKDLGHALILAVFAFMGMEVPLSASGEVARPSRTIPQALALSMVTVTALYIAIQLIAQGILGSELAVSKAPLADAMAHISPTLRLLMLSGAALSMFSFISSDILSTPRILFAFARDGLLPRALGKVHARSQVPRIAILCYSALAAGLALTGTFAELAVLSSLVTAAVYIAVCAASWWLARRGVAFAAAPLNFRWLGTAASVGIASMLALIAMASRAEVIGLFAVIAVSATVYLLQVRIARARKA